MCAPALCPLAEGCLGDDVAENTPFRCSCCVGPQDEMGQMLNVLSVWASDVEARFSVTVSWELAISVLDEDIGWWRRCFSTCTPVPE